VLEFRPHKNFSQNNNSVNGKGRVVPTFVIAGWEKKSSAWLTWINLSLRVLRNFSAMGASN